MSAARMVRSVNGARCLHGIHHKGSCSLGRSPRSGSSALSSSPKWRFVLVLKELARLLSSNTGCSNDTERHKPISAENSSRPLDGAVFSIGFAGAWIRRQRVVLPGRAVHCYLSSPYARRPCVTGLGTPSTFAARSGLKARMSADRLATMMTAPSL